MRIPQFRWAEHDSTASKLLAHLQAPTYQQLATAIARARTANAGHVAAISQGLADFASRVDSAVGQIPGLMEWRGTNLGPGVGILYRATVRKLLFEDLQSRSGGGYIDPVDLAIIPNPVGVLGKTDHTMVWNTSHRVAEGTKEQLDQLDDRLRPLLANKDLRGVVEQVQREDRARISDPSIAEFESQRTTLIELLDSKQEALVGRCALCPRFLGIQPKVPE